MSAVITAIALFLVVSSVVAGSLAAVMSRSLVAGIPVMLDLWVAAGLLRLTQEASWPKIGSAAALIAIRKLIVHALDSRDTPAAG